MWRYLPGVSTLVLVGFVLSGCQDKVICAAFQSTYILDDSTRNAYYSYVWQLDEATRTEYLASTNPGSTDSLVTSSQPKTDYYAHAGDKVVPWRVKKRTKYGIVKYEPYWLKNYRMRTAPMENVFAPEPAPELPAPPAEFLAAESDDFDVDSLGVSSLDSLAVDIAQIEEEPAATEEGEDEIRYLYGYDPADNFNVEQEYYNKYYLDLMINNRPKPDLSAIQAADSLAAAVPDSLVEEKGAGLRGLFKRKRNESDTTQTDPVEPVVEEEEEEDSGND